MAMRSVFHVLLVAAIPVLPAALARAGDSPTLIPLYSGSDGSSASIEVSRSGKRATAIPVLEIPGVAARKTTGGGESGAGTIAPSTGVGGEKGNERIDADGFLKRHRSLLVREGPEGVSLGNGFDLLGDIQEALHNRKNKRVNPEEFERPRNSASEGGIPVPELARPVQIDDANHPEEFRSGLR